MKLAAFFLALQLMTMALLAQPVITQQPTNLTVAVGGNAGLSVAVSGPGPFTYQWQFNGTNLPIITTVAGNGTGGYFGNGVIATNARLDSTGVGVDSTGNLYLADAGNNLIRMVGTNGIINNVAGTGFFGSGGDSGPATSAGLDDPAGVAVAGTGKYYIADEGNNRIRLVGTNGIINTVAGTGSPGYSGDTGAAISATLNSPAGVAVDSTGNLYIADKGNNCVRMVGINGIINTVAGTGSAGYLGDNGPATSATLDGPAGVAVDGTGNLYIADYNNRCIRMVGTNGIITTLAGSGLFSYSGDGGAATNASFRNPAGVTVDSAGNVYIADEGNNRIRVVGTNGIINTIVGTGNAGFSGDGGAATGENVYEPAGMAIDSAGNFYIADYGDDRIRKVWNNGSPFPALLFNDFTPTNSGNYQVVITGNGGSVTSSVASLTVLPLLITQQPQSQAVPVSSNVVFTVSASGFTPMNYQWYFSSSNLQATAGGVAQALSGFVYGVTLTNGGAGYIMVPQVRFIGGGGGGAGGTVTLSNGMVTAVTVTNAGSGYTSLPAVVIDPPGGLLIGQTNASLPLNAITSNNAGNYFVVVTNGATNVTSSMAALTIEYPPGISQPPQNQTVLAGSGAGFSVVAAGTPPFYYQWWMTQGNNATAVPVVTNGFVLAASLTSHGSGYLTVPNVQITGGSGSGAGGYAMVSNQMVSAITITNAGSGYATPPVIQIGAPPTISLTGQTNTTLTLPAVTNGNAGNYFVVVTNNFGSVTSSAASLIIVPPGYNLISAPVWSHGQISLSFAGIADGNYALDRSFSLSPANWIPQVTNPADANGNVIFTNTPNPATNNFWRIRSVP